MMASITASSTLEKTSYTLLHWAEHIIDVFGFFLFMTLKFCVWV